MRRTCSGGAQIADMHEPTINVYTSGGARGYSETHEDKYRRVHVECIHG
jgi:hypothetical protein